VDLGLVHHLFLGAPLEAPHQLHWPGETARVRTESEPQFAQPGSNICLDFHGDPQRAKLAVFSDGNHHMALQESLRAFVTQYPEVEDIFYLTTPPGVALKFLRVGYLDVGNLRLSVSPHVFISPPAVLEQLVAEGRMKMHVPFVRSRGVVLLVRKGNPKQVVGVESLLRPDVRLFLSNPVSEKVSYEIYVNCLRRLASEHGVKLEFLAHPPGRPDPDKLVYGKAIHHREAPQALADGRADVAVVFYHLALRYQRIFPELFEFVWPEGAPGASRCDVGSIHCGLIGDGGVWGTKLLEFLRGQEVAAIYDRHGLSAAT
jgi:hypothetical protein